MMKILYNTQLYNNNNNLLIDSPHTYKDQVGLANLGWLVLQLE